VPCGLGTSRICGSAATVFGLERFPENSDGIVEAVALNEKIEDVFDAQNRALSATSPCYLTDRPQAPVRIQRDSIERKFGRREHLESGREAVSWEVLEVRCDDGPGATDDSGSDDMLVIRIRESIGAFQSFPPFDLSVIERPTHLINEMLSGFTSLIVRDQPLGELRLFVELELL
jgi:hypothetical protein